MEENPSRNTYYFLPFLLGLLGLIYHLNTDQRNFSVVMWLFVMMGIALVVYFNTCPSEPRERDYVYAGSFYAFCIWIGIGVMALRDLFAIATRDGKGAAIAATIIGLVVPGILAAENWDDHDRSGRSMARDIGWNYLNSTPKNAIIVNYGDNDTFPLWYNQEVDGVRSGITEDYNHLPITTYRRRLAQQLYDAQRSMSASDIHISLAHEVPADAYIYTSEDHNPETERFLTSPELILAGHYCGGVWNIPLFGAFYVPDSSLERYGWFPEKNRVSGVREVDDAQIYVTRGLSSSGDTPLMPFRLLNSPEVSVITITATTPQSMLE
jgi:hypothetical protein